MLKGDHGNLAFQEEVFHIFRFVNFPLSRNVLHVSRYSFDKRLNS